MDRFPLLIDFYKRRIHPDWPVSVPWKLIEPHEAQAFNNHSQSLRRLASRGGLGPLEMLAVLRDVEFCKVRDIPEDAAITEILRMGRIHRPDGSTPDSVCKAVEPLDSGGA